MEHCAIHRNSRPDNTRPVSECASCWASYATYLEHQCSGLLRENFELTDQLTAMQRRIPYNPEHADGPL